MIYLYKNIVKLEKKVLSEINRFREILGQNILIESTPPFNLLQQLFKIVGGSSDNLLSTVLKKSNDPQVLKLKNQIDLVSRELGQSPNDLITKIQQDTLSPEEFDSLVASFMRTDELFFKRLLKIYVENSPPLRQIDDLIGTLEKTLEERGIAPTADEIGDLQLQLFKTIDNDPKLGEDIKNIIKERIAERLSKLPISTKKIAPKLKLQPDPSWTKDFKVKSPENSLDSYFKVGRPYTRKTMNDLLPYFDNTFDPKRVKVMNFDVIDSMEGGELTQRFVARLVIDDKVPFLIYTSSGKSTPGLKGPGQWTLFSGWVLKTDGTTGWWIKGGEREMKLTQGGSPFFTGLAEYLKKNNVSGLKKY